MNPATRHFLLFSALCALVAGALMVPGLGGGFMLDDAQTIVHNPLVHMEHLDLESLLTAAPGYLGSGGTRPLPMMSFALDYWRQGALDAPTFKSTNLLIHVLSAFFLALFFRRLLLLAGWKPQRAAIAALALTFAWAAHPLQVSSVLYVVQRMQTMANLFVVMALWAYLGLRQAQIEGRRGWPQGTAAAALWLLALASKEDAVLFPAYCLLLELTVLQFRARQAWRSRDLRRTYLVLTLAGAGLYLFWALPHYWSWATYPGRDFSSAERLLTQARVLVLYLYQILLPLPSHLPFNYDTFVVSRGLLQPASTLASLLLITLLLAIAWYLRRRRPVFAFGVLLFFAGHFVTSNVLPLELVFEHRNQLPLIGAVLAIGDLIAMAFDRWKVPPRAAATGIAVLLLALASAGAVRAWTWGDPLRFARYNVEIAPDSPRAWLMLGGNYFDLAGRRAGKDSPYLEQAIQTVATAAEKTGSPSAYSNIVIYKTIQGTVTSADWERLLHRLEQARMLPATKGILWTTIENVRAGIGLDTNQALRVIQTISRRADFQPLEYLRIGVFVYTQTNQQDAALPYFLQAAEGLPSDQPAISQLRRDLAAQGHADWAEALERAARREPEPGD